MKKILTLLTLSLISTAHASSRAYNADYICSVRDDDKPKTLMYTVAAVNESFAPLANRVIVIKHDTRTGKQTVVVDADATAEKFKNNVGKHEDAIRYSGKDKGGSEVGLSVFLMSTGPTGIAQFLGGSTANMDCESSTTLIISDDTIFVSAAESKYICSTMYSQIPEIRVLKFEEGGNIRSFSWVKLNPKGVAEFLFYPSGQYSVLRRHENYDVIEEKYQEYSNSDKSLELFITDDRKHAALYIGKGHYSFYECNKNEL